MTDDEVQRRLEEMRSKSAAEAEEDPSERAAKLMAMYPFLAAQLSGDAPSEPAAVAEVSDDEVQRRLEEMRSKSATEAEEDPSERAAKLMAMNPSLAPQLSGDAPSEPAAATDAAPVSDDEVQRRLEEMRSKSAAEAEEDPSERAAKLMAMYPFLAAQLGGDTPSEPAAAKDAAPRTVMERRPQDTLIEVKGYTGGGDLTIVIPALATGAAQQSSLTIGRETWRMDGVPDAHAGSNANLIDGARVTRDPRDGRLCVEIVTGDFSFAIGNGLSSAELEWLVAVLNKYLENRSDVVGDIGIFDSGEFDTW